MDQQIQPNVTENPFSVSATLRPAIIKEYQSMDKLSPKSKETEKNPSPEIPIKLAIRSSYNDDDEDEDVNSIISSVIDPK